MHNKNGEEILDPTPVNIPIRFRVPTPLNERIRQMVRQEASLYAKNNGDETFDEADDFNISDDPADPSSPWEEDFDPEVPHIASREAEIRHGAVKNFDESKIKAGQDELKKYSKSNYSKPKTSPKEKSEPSGEPSLDEEFVQEKPNAQ